MGMSHQRNTITTPRRMVTVPRILKQMAFLPRRVLRQQRTFMFFRLDMDSCACDYAGHDEGCTVLMVFPSDLTSASVWMRVMPFVCNIRCLFQKPSSPTVTTTITMQQTHAVCALTASSAKHLQCWRHCTCRCARHSGNAAAAGTSTAQTPGQTRCCTL